MKSITFDTPLQSNGKSFVSVNMRTPTIGDEEDAQVMAVDMDKGGVLLTVELCLFSILTGIMYDDLRTLPAYEVKKMRAAYHELNTPRPTTRGNGKAREKPQEKPDARHEETGTTPPQD